LEPDNLLAFLALLGLLRALEASAEGVRARISWTLEAPPVRPRLHLDREVETTELAKLVASGVAALAAVHAFEGRSDLNYLQDECRRLLVEAARASSAFGRARADLLAALMSDAAVKEGKERVVDPTPLCLLFGQGHQHFLQRLAEVPNMPAPTAHARGKRAAIASTAECIAEALYRRWHREDPTPSFRWDPNEDVRYATMAGDPTDATFNSGTQHGANRLAAIGLSALTVAVEDRAGRMRAKIVGGARDAEGFSFAWPIWRDAASLAGVKALLTHPDLRGPGALRHLGVDHVLICRRVSVGKFMNFTRARPLA
jgi:hypothetical protein